MPGLWKGARKTPKRRRDVIGMSSIDIGGGVSQKGMRPSFQSDQPCSPHTPYASAVSWSIGADQPPKSVLVRPQSWLIAACCPLILVCRPYSRSGIVVNDNDEYTTSSSNHFFR